MPSVESTTAAAAGAVDAMKKDVRTPIVNSGNPGAYPISGFTYLLIYKDLKDPARASALTGFLKWAMGDGQKLAPALSYAPLPQPVVAINNAAIAGLTAGGRKISAR